MENNMHKHNRKRDINKYKYDDAFSACDVDKSDQLIIAYNVIELPSHRQKTQTRNAYAKNKN